MADIRYLEKFLKDMKKDVEDDVSDEMTAVQIDFEDLIRELHGGRGHVDQIEQIIINLNRGIYAKIENTIENLDDPDLVSENIDQLYDIMKKVRHDIQRILKEIYDEFESKFFHQRESEELQKEAEEMLDILKGANKAFNEIFEDFEDAYYNDELNFDM